MNYRMIGYLLSVVLLIEAALLGAPTLCALCYGEDVLPFVYTAAILVGVALPLFLTKPKNTRIYAKEGFVCVAASWLLLSAFGALPFVFSGAIPHYIDAFFETVSGLTTTGASILSAVEGLPRGILFWRSFTHWIGGMGVLVFMLALLPSTDGRAIHLMRAEVPGPQKGKLVPKLRQTAIILYAIYMFFTVLETVLLLCTGMPLFDSLVNTFGTVGTGGFSVKNASIGAYNNPAAEWIIGIFMLICGTNFNIFYFILIRQFHEIKKNEELRTYLLLTLAATAAIVINTWHMFEGAAGDCIRAAFFQVTTIMSTSGFATVNFDLWPAFSKMVLVLLMITGACAGSTAGGLKISRVIILVKSVFREIKHMLRPRSVNVLRLDGDPLPDETTRSALGYLALYCLILTSSVLLISLDGFDFETNVTGVLACFNNVGPGFSVVGPTGNFGGFSLFSKLVLSFCMLFGRLEIMPMLILLSPSTWKRR